MSAALHGRASRAILGLWTAFVLAFLFAPLALIALYAFNASNVQSWPIPGLSLRWFGSAFANDEIRAALRLSLEAGAASTIIAVVLGTLAAFAVQRFRFRGREALAFIVVLPIALPGIITGMALNAFFAASGMGLSFWTIVIGHATFCIVVVYNNVIARLRRLPRSLGEASMDLGADTWRTFVKVTLPMISGAVVTGALLAFALSFDEIIVTTFTAGAQNTLPLWIFGAIRLGQKLPEVNVVVLGVTLITFVPVVLAYGLMGRERP